MQLCRSPALSSSATKMDVSTQTCEEHFQELACYPRKKPSSSSSTLVRCEDEPCEETASTHAVAVFTSTTSSSAIFSGALELGERADKREKSMLVSPPPSADLDLIEDDLSGGTSPSLLSPVSCASSSTPLVQSKSVPVPLLGASNSSSRTQTMSNTARSGETPPTSSLNRCGVYEGGEGGGGEDRQGEEGGGRGGGDGQGGGGGGGDGQGGDEGRDGGGGGGVSDIIPHCSPAISGDHQDTSRG